MTERKLKVLHAAVSMNPSVGVVRQMEWEQQAADALGLDWQVVLHTPKEVCSPVVVNRADLPHGTVGRYFSLRRDFYRWLHHASADFDLVLLRHSVHDFFELQLARAIGSKLLTVHHTLEMPELHNNSRTLGPLRAALERYVGTQSLRHCAGMVGVTEEILHFERARAAADLDEKQGFVYPNGILVSSKPLVDRREGGPQFLFVAAHFADWHGFDLLLDAMSRDSAPCILHVVGSVPDALARRCQADARVHLHGLLAAAEIKPLMDAAWCGLSSFALHRKGMADACTLKVREYLDAGLPVYSGHRDSGLPESFPYFKNGPADLASIIEFSKKNLFVPRDVVRNVAEPFISKVALLRRFYEQLCESEIGAL